MYKIIIFLVFLLGITSCDINPKYRRYRGFVNELTIVEPTRTYDCKANKFVKLGQEYFLIKIVYDTIIYSYPVTSPAGCNHYDAYFTLYKVCKSKYGYFYLQYGKTFKGEYTKFLCYEDDPSDLKIQANERL